MFGPLINAWLSHECGENDAPSAFREVPPHLAAVTWQFSCCVTWTATADAELHRGQWLGPSQACPSCHEWRQGVHAAFTLPENS